jgi:NDP-sugar pyrophosphorylase family protein
MIDRAVVLAAGRGSRLGSLTESTPKPLIEVGGESLISHVLKAIRGAGIYEVVVVTGYRSTDIEDHTWGFAGL